MSNYYKIECAETLLKIDAFFAKHDELYDAVRKMCEHFGFERHITHDSIVLGVRFYNLVADPSKDVIDEKLWKTSKHRRSGFLNIYPRAAAKSHKKLYESMIPENIQYTELNKLILADGVDLWGKSYGYSYKKGEYFKFETSLKVSSLAVEILGSEYRKDSEEAA